MCRSPLTLPRRRPRVAAFTLVELLVVTAIIALLAALVFPLFGQIRKQADSTRCLSQLTQIGAAIGAYVADHEDSMPGPLTFLQSAAYRDETPGSLARLLENYLGPGGAVSPTKSSSAERHSPLFLCPAAARQFTEQSKPGYLVNTLTLPFSKQSAWGDVALGQQPLMRSALVKWSEATRDGNPLSLSELWAFRDGDQDYLRLTSQAPPRGRDLPARPVHGDHRNALFFDYHVARTELMVLHIPQLVGEEEPESPQTKD